MPSVSSETFPVENENGLCDFLDTTVTKKPCSLEITRGVSSKIGVFTGFDLISIAICAT